MYYIFVENGKINGSGECECLTEGFKNIEVTEEVYNNFIKDTDRYIYQNGEIIPNPDYEEIKRQKERERLDALTLTPSDVERALLSAKGWDFDDLKSYLKTKGYTDLQIKAIGVELRANDFYRGATMPSPVDPSYDIRIVDTIGDLLGYTSDDMDYLFQNKELPNGETSVDT